MRKKLLHDLVNQLQIITSSFDNRTFDRAHEAIERARKLLDGLEVLCGPYKKANGSERKAS